MIGAWLIREESKMGRTTYPSEYLLLGNFDAWELRMFKNLDV